MVLAEAPELLDLLGDFHAKLHDIKTVIIPVLEKVRRGELATSNGIAFLDVKYREST